MKDFANPNNSYHGTRVMVLGASGFIGRWVARDLCRRGARVALVVRDQRDAEPVFSLYDIRGDVCELDLQHFAAVGKLLKSVQPAIVFNLAGYGMDRAEVDDRTAYRINAHLLEVVIETLAKGSDSEWPGQRIVHVGTALEYGTIGGSLSENSLPNPTTLYGKSKLAGTQLLVNLCKAYGIKGLTARPFTVYGPGEARGRLLPSLLEAAKSQQSVRLTSGEQKRDFVYVEDVSTGLLRLGIAHAAPGDIVNLATGRLTAVRVFAETAARIAGIPQDHLKFGEIPPLAEEMHHAEVAIERLGRLTAWIPPTGVAAGIQKTVDSMSIPSALSTGWSSSQA